MIFSVLSRLAAIAAGGWVAFAQPFATNTNLAVVVAFCLVVLVDELELLPSTDGESV